MLLPTGPTGKQPAYQFQIEWAVQLEFLRSSVFGLYKVHVGSGVFTSSENVQTDETEVEQMMRSVGGEVG